MKSTLAVLFASFQFSTAFQAGPQSLFSHTSPLPAFVSQGKNGAGRNHHNGPLQMSAIEGLDAKSTALVLIEYQNEFTTEGGKLHDAVKDCMEATGTLENSKRVLDAAREAGITVIHVPIAFEKGHKEIASSPYGILAGVKDGEAFTAGEWGAEICDVMKPTEGELVCKGKAGLCGFESTNLDFLLRQNKCDTILLSGYLTNCCVESTMRSGYERGYKIYTLKDCCSATSVAAQDATYEHNFGMFSIPTMSEEVIPALQSLTVTI